MRQHMKFVSLHLMALILAFTFVTAARSEETSVAAPVAKNAANKQDAADELVELLHANSLAEGPKRLLSLYAKKMADQALKENTNLSAAQKDKLAQLPSRVGEVVQSNLKWDRLLSAFAEIYRKVYTPEEIRAQLSFYRSKEGQSVLKKLPKLANQIGLEEAVSLKPVYTQLQKVINEQVKNIVSTPLPLSSAASTP